MNASSIVTGTPTRSASTCAVSRARNSGPEEDPHLSPTQRNRSRSAAHRARSRPAASRCPSRRPLQLARLVVWSGRVAPQQDRAHGAAPPAAAPASPRSRCGARASTDRNRRIRSCDQHVLPRLPSVRWLSGSPSRPITPMRPNVPWVNTTRSPGAFAAHSSIAATMRSRHHVVHLKALDVGIAVRVPLGEFLWPARLPRLRQ